MFLPTQSKTRWAQGCRPRSKQQVGFEKEDQDLVSALAASKNASCWRCAKRRAGIRDRDRPLPSSRPLARSLCGHTTRSSLADGEAGKTPYSRFYGDRICGTSGSDRRMRLLGGFHLSTSSGYDFERLAQFCFGCPHRSLRQFHSSLPNN